MGDEADLLGAAEALVRSIENEELSEDHADDEMAALVGRIVGAMAAGKVSDAELLALAERTGLGISTYRSPRHRGTSQST